MKYPHQEGFINFEDHLFSEGYWILKYKELKITLRIKTNQRPLNILQQARIGKRRAPRLGLKKSKSTSKHRRFSTQKIFNFTEPKTIDGILCA